MAKAGWQLEVAWKARGTLYALAMKAQREADFAMGKAARLSMDDHKDKINDYKDRAMNLRRDAFDRIAEADLMWEREVKIAGRKIVGWMKPNVKKGSYECHLDDGQIWKP